KSNLEDTPVNDRYAVGMHAVPPPMTGNCMPSGPDVEIDYSKFTYGPKQTSTDESDSKPSEYAFCESDSSEYESDIDDDLVSNVQEDKEKPSFAFLDLVKHVKNSREIGKLLLRPQQVVIGETKEILGTKSSNTTVDQRLEKNDPHRDLKDKGIIDSGCSRHMIGNKAHLADYQEFKGGSIAFGGSNERITGKGNIKAGSNARTPQQNRVVERKNRTLIEAARTMLADSFLPTTFWAKVVNTTCYILNMVLVTKPQNKTAYELLTGKQPIISYLRPFGFHVIILNTIDQLGKFDGKSDSGFLVGYSLNSKVFRVYNLETKRVEENLHVNFLENKPNVTGKGHAWMFNLDYLTNSMNYEPVSVENQANKSAISKEANNSAGTEANDDQGANSKEIDLHEEHFVLPIWPAYSTTVKSSGDKIEKTTDDNTCEKPVGQVEQIFWEELEKLKRQEKEANVVARKETTHENQDANTNNTNLLNAVSKLISTVGPSRVLNNGESLYPDDPLMPHLEDIYASQSEGIFTDSSYDDEGVVTDFNNLETTVNVCPTPTTRIHSIHPKTQILGDPMSVFQTRSKVNKNLEAYALVSYIQKQPRNNYKDFQHCLFACFLSQIEPKKISQALEDESWVDAMQEELLQFQIQKVWILVDFPFEKKAIGTKWVYRNKKDERGVVVRNKARLVAQGHRQEEGIDYHKKSWCDEFEELMQNRFQMSSMGELTFFLGLQVKQKEDGIFISQDKYVAEILKKFDFLCVKTATQKPLVKDEEAVDVDEHLYRSMIDSLMYLTAFRPDIMFAVCACSRFWVTPKTSHL
nr:ribonuclease H-like domain-containing protein [Tanacetum cinerariifolium]